MLPKMWKRGRTGPVERSVALLAEFERLGGDSKDDVAVNLAALWDRFGMELGGVGEFARLPPREQDAYFDQLKQAVARMAGIKGSGLEHYFYGVALMLLYVVALRDGGPHAAEISRIVASLIDRGRALAAQGQFKASDAGREIWPRLVPGGRAPAP